MCQLESDRHARTLTALWPTLNMSARLSASAAAQEAAWQQRRLEVEKALRQVEEAGRRAADEVAKTAQLLEAHHAADAEAALEDEDELSEAARLAGQLEQIRRQRIREQRAKAEALAAKAVLQEKQRACEAMQPPGKDQVLRQYELTGSFSPRSQR